VTGLGFYLVPLYVTSLQSTQAMAGRALMVYGVMVVLLTPLAAGWARSRGRMEQLVGGGLVLSGLGGLLLLADAGVGPVFGAMALLGVGQALSMSAQSALVGEHCRASIERMGESTVYAVYRLLERLGNAAGPMLAALLVTAVGYRSSFILLGGFVALCGLLFVALARWFGRADRRLA
jgi:predicted MFS family arabinose efflux permease